MSVKAWNDEEEAELIKLYKEQDEKDVNILATHFGKGYRSVISKLVNIMGGDVILSPIFY